MTKPTFEWTFSLGNLAIIVSGLAFAGSIWVGLSIGLAKAEATGKTNAEGLKSLEQRVVRVEDRLESRLARIEEKLDRALSRQ